MSSLTLRSLLNGRLLLIVLWHRRTTLLPLLLCPRTKHLYLAMLRRVLAAAVHAAVRTSEPLAAWVKFPDLSGRFSTQLWDPSQLYRPMTVGLTLAASRAV